MRLTNEAALCAEINRLGEAMKQPIPTGWGPYEYLFACGEFKRLEGLLSEESELDDFASRRMCYVANGGSGLSVDHLARWLVQRVLISSPAAALADLASFVDCTHIPCTFVCGLIGVSVDHQIRITNEISLIPFSMADLNPTLHTRNPSSPIARMTAGLAYRFAYPKTIGDVGDVLCSRQGVAIFQSIFGRLELVRLCLGLVKPSPSAVAFETYLVPENPGIASGSTNRSRYDADFIEPVPYNDADCAKAETIHDLYVGSPAKLRSRLAVALSRFHTGMARIPSVNSAIDLGIILETIFLPDANGELTYRLSVRAARLLGRSVEERRDLMRIMAKIYDLRSKAVHTGTLPSKLKPIAGFDSVEALIRHGYRIAADATIEVMKQQVEDWDDVVAS